MTDLAARCPVAHAYDPLAVARATDADRAAVYQALHDEAPVFQNPATGAWVITRYEDVRQVLLDKERISAVGSIGIDKPSTYPSEVQAVLASGYERFPGIIEMDPPEHTAYRELVGGSFAPRRIAALEPDLRALAVDLIEAFRPDGHADLVVSFTFPFALGVMCRLIGIPGDDVAEVDRMSDGFRTLEGGTISILPLARQIEAAEDFVAFQRYAADLVADRRANPREDLVSEVANATVHGRPVTVEEAISWIIHLLFAGHETNARSLASTVHRMLKDDRSWEALVADPSRAANAVEEGLRLEPPVTYHARRTVSPIILSGVEVPANQTLHLLFAAANRDAEVFPDPDRFVGGRPNDARHLGFGWGAHHCIGAPVARLESRIGLECLAEMLPGLALDADPELPHEEHAMLRGLEHLPVRWTLA